MTDGSRSGVAGTLARLGGWCWRHAALVLLAWLALAALAAVAASGLSDRLLSGSGDISGSASWRVDREMRAHFARHDDQALVLTLASPTLERRRGGYDPLLAALEARLARLPAVAGTIHDRDIGDPRLLPAHGTGRYVLIDLATGGLLASEQQVPLVRAAVDETLRPALGRVPDLEWAVSGRAALTYDLNRFSEADAARAEVRALPLTLVILVLAFGSLVAPVLPIVLALIGRAVALGIVVMLSGPVDMSNLVQSIVTMLAIALGIDYSLFLLHRYRRELRDGEDGTALAARERAMRRAMAQSGAAVLYSGVTVAIGMGALLATPLMETRSIGLGGLLVVLVTLAVTLTLVPAVLRLVGPRLLDWPPLIANRRAERRTESRWARWAEGVLRRPLLAALASLALLAALAAPALHTRFGFPDSEFVPHELEYSRGLAMLERMRLKGLVAPVLVLVERRDGGPALDDSTRPVLTGLMRRLEADPRARAVLGPLPSTRPPPLASGEGALVQAATARMIRAEHVGADGRRLFFRLVPADGVGIAGLRSLAAEVRAMAGDPRLAVTVGGQAQYFNDFDQAVAASYPLAVGLVLAMSAIALLLVFRAPLAAAKALVLNLLSVAAGYGVVVLVFQLGVGAALFGVAEPTGVVPITVPLVMFCVLFGLSMDYEIFLLSRMRALYADSRDNAASIRCALADTGSVITSAALIMVAVFGAFAFARLIIVQMLGLGLAVAVLVDAVVIRSVLGPALMTLAGRWNWWPALPSPAPRPTRL